MDPRVAQLNSNIEVHFHTHTYTYIRLFIRMLATCDTNVQVRLSRAPLSHAPLQSASLVTTTSAVDCTVEKSSQYAVQLSFCSSSAHSCAFIMQTGNTTQLPSQKGWHRWWRCRSGRLITTLRKKAGPDQFGILVCHRKRRRGTGVEECLVFLS